MKEKWKVFYYNGKELCAYTVRGTFDGEEEDTKELLTYKNEIDPNDIKVVIEDR
jgi:hypothetical protein